MLLLKPKYHYICNYLFTPLPRSCSFPVVARGTPRTAPWALLRSSRVGSRRPGMAFPRAPYPAQGPGPHSSPPGLSAPAAATLQQGRSPGLHSPAWSWALLSQAHPRAQGGATLWEPLVPVGPPRRQWPPSWLAGQGLPHCWHQRGGSRLLPAPCRGTEAGVPPPHRPSPAMAVTSSSRQGKLETRGGRAGGDSSQGCGTEAI